MTLSQLVVEKPLVDAANQTPEHPADEELAAFALGKEVPHAEVIAEHIAICSRCESLVANMPRDAFLGILHKARQGASVTGPFVPTTDARSMDELPEELRLQTKYTFLKKLGGGGMGVVYLAEHNLMKRKVAIKLIPPEMIGDAAVRERFLQEVVSAAALEHPNVVRAYAAEEFGPHMAFEMEFVDGLDLDQVVKSKGPLSTAHAVNYIRQAAQALQQGMLKSLVHRDIKPGNLMLTRAGNVKVADFGLAKFSWESDKARDHSLTGMNIVMGTPDYMAPEQARSAKSADIRADIYSLGCTFYYLLTGRPPFIGKSMADLILRHWEDPRPDVRLFRSDVPSGLSQYVQQMMAQEPADRPHSPKEIVDWLTKFAKRELAKKEAEEKPREDLVAAVTKETAADVYKLTPTTKKKAANRKRTRSRKKWPMIAGAIMCLFAGLAILSAAGVFRPKPKDGSIIPENRPVGTGEISTVVPPSGDPEILVGKTHTAGEVAEVEITSGLQMTFCWIPPGEAQLGSSRAVRQEVLKQIRQDKEPGWLASEAEEVRGRFKTKGFWLAKYAVTQGEWQALMGVNPSWFSKQGIGKDKVAGMNTNRFPVERVSWDDCQEFLRKLNVTATAPGSMGKGKFALPHEDEWEFACLGGKGNRQAFYFGRSLNGKQANCDGSSPFGTTTKGPSIGRTAEVGSYENMAKHPWGLCDMLGNVYQWCDNQDVGIQDVRVNRGGAWGYAARDCCSASRGRYAQGLGNFYIGCRVAFLPSGH